MRDEPDVFKAFERVTRIWSAEMRYAPKPYGRSEAVDFFKEGYRMVRGDRSKGKVVARLLRKILRPRIPPKYGLRLRVVPRGDDEHADVIVITDYFRRKNYAKRWEFIDRALDETLPIPKRMDMTFGIVIVPFTQREAQERGL